MLERVAQEARWLNGGRLSLTDGCLQRLICVYGWFTKIDVLCSFLKCVTGEQT